MRFLGFVSKSAVIIVHSYGVVIGIFIFIHSLFAFHLLAFLAWWAVFLYFFNWFSHLFWFLSFTEGIFDTQTRVLYILQRLFSCGQAIGLNWGLDGPWTNKVIYIFIIYYVIYYLIVLFTLRHFTLHGEGFVRDSTNHFVHRYGFLSRKAVLFYQRVVLDWFWFVRKFIYRSRW